jgi:hypothetical protein
VFDLVIPNLDRAASTKKIAMTLSHELLKFINHFASFLVFLFPGS